MIPFSPIVRQAQSGHHAGLIQRLFRHDAHPETDRLDLITTTSRRLSVIDTGFSPKLVHAEGDTVVHILWQAQEPGATIRVDDQSLAIAPGDSVAIALGSEWMLSPDQLAVVLVQHQQQIVGTQGPTHGTERFSGYNRATEIALLPATALTRWKLTGPLTIPTPESDMVIVSLFGNMAIQYPVGITMLSQGHASVIRPEVGPITLVPNGLAYVLVID